MNFWVPFIGGAVSGVLLALGLYAPYSISRSFKVLQMGIELGIAEERVRLRNLKYRGKK